MNLKYLFKDNSDLGYDVELYSEDNRYFSGHMTNLDDDTNEEIWLEFDGEDITNQYLTPLLENDIKEFLDSFISNYHKKKNEKEEVERDGVNYEDEEAEGEINEPSDNDKYKPYNVELIRVETKPFTLESLYSKIEKNNINLSPDFQRNPVWSNKQKCLFIESILLRIPVPVLYLSQDSEGNYDVVDGLQRLTTIRDFMNNKFALKGLEYLDNQCGALYYSSEESIYGNREIKDKQKCLSLKFKTRIEDTQFMCNVIDPQTPSKARYDIFYRINTGGSKLNHQEVRNCFSSKKNRELLNYISNSTEFLNATDYSVSKKRMADHELVLRFLSFYIYKEFGIGEEYKSSMTAYLNEYNEVIDKLNDDQLIQIKKDSISALSNCCKLFGKYAFRKYDSIESINGRKKVIHKSLFIAFMMATYNVKQEEIDHLEYKEYENIKKFIEFKKTNEKYNQSITEGTSDKVRLEFVIKETKQFVKKLVEG